MEVSAMGKGSLILLGLLGLGYLALVSHSKSVPKVKGQVDYHIFSPYIREYAIRKYGSLERAYWEWT